MKEIARCSTPSSGSAEFYGVKGDNLKLKIGGVRLCWTGCSAAWTSFSWSPIDTKARLQPAPDTDN